MNTQKIIAILLIALIIRPGIYAQDLKQSNAHIGLVYPISTNGLQAAAYSNSFSLHAIAGVSGAETGLSLAGFALLTKDARGAQLAGFMNSVKNRSAGFQAAGFLNLTGSSMGVHLAGFANINRDSSSGFQAAGFINTSKRSGVQVAGFINKSADTRSQVAGFINIAKKVKGIQLAGFINIADSSDYPIGLVNIIRNGERSISVTTDETLTTLVTFRSGSSKLYGILGVGYNDKKNENLYAWEGGLGAHLQVTRNFRINPELVAIGLTDFKSGDYFRGSFRLLPAVSLGRHVEFFAGPTFNYIRSENGKGADLVSHYVWSERESSGVLHGLYFGATGGLNFIF